MIIPAIMPRDINDLQGKVAQVRGFVNFVQLDLMDGNFVKAQTWPYNDKDVEFFESIMREEEGLPYWEEMNFEFDLMVRNAKDQMDTFLKLGPSRLVFHIEAEDQNENAFRDFLEGIDLYIRENIEIGVAINTTTPVENIFPLIPHIDFVQCMGIEHDGYQGEAFDPRVLEHLKVLHAKYPELTLSVDGAVNAETITKLAQAGATRFVAGSAVWKGVDPCDAIEHLENLAQGN